MTSPTRPPRLIEGQHLLGIADMSRQEIVSLLDLADRYVEVSRQIEKRHPVLAGRTQINLFFEASTRTQSSFEIAGKRLGADVMNMAVSTSAVSKGETLLDTAMTLNAMQPEILVVRHPSSGAVELLAQKVSCAVVNAGDGQHEHPTQALLDALTIRRRKGRIEGLIVTICGDVLHSRVARSNIHLLNKLGAQVRVVAPSTLLPSGIASFGVEVHRNMRDGLDGADIVMMLRLQLERMSGAFVPSQREYYRFYRAQRREAALCQARCACHASGPHEPRHRDRFRRRRRPAIGHPRAGRDGCCRPHGRARCAGPQPSRRGQRMMAPVSRASSNRRAYLNARIVDPSQGIDGLGGIVVEDGWILAAGRIGNRAKLLAPVPPIVDCRGLVLMPGLVDMRVFTGEPGAEYRETLATASEAAAAGGVTTMIVMPNTNPVIDDAAIVDFILRRASDTAIVRVAPMAALTKGLQGESMTEIGALKEAGAVAVTDGNRAVANARVFRRALSYANDFDMLVVQHVEEPTLATGVMNASETASRLGLPGIPAAAEVIMLERDLRLVELTGARYHAAQLSSRTSLDVIRAAKARGLPVTCGVSIHHLTLNELDIGAYRTFFKLSPPLRSEDDGARLVEGVADGTIDVIVSSHDPQSADTKRLPFAEAEFGAIGLETMFSAAMSLHHDDRCAVEPPGRCYVGCAGAHSGPRMRTLEPGRAGRFRLGRPSPAPGRSRTRCCGRGPKIRPSSTAPWKVPSSKLSLQEKLSLRKVSDRRDEWLTGRASALLSAVLAALCRLSLRFDPLWPFAHAMGRPRRCQIDRVRQYRRDQCAAHRQQEGRGAHAHPGRREGHRPCAALS